MSQNHAKWTKQDRFYKNETGGIGTKKSKFLTQKLRKTDKQDQADKRTAVKNHAKWTEQDRFYKRRPAELGPKKKVKNNFQTQIDAK